jgi:hypothetical protein
MQTILALQSEAILTEPIADEEEVVSASCREFVYVSCNIVGRFIIPDARATLFDIWGYQFSWVEVLLFTAAIVAMAEQVKVAKPGINNTAEVFLIGTIAVIQLLLFALAAAKVLVLGIAAHTHQPRANCCGA